MDDDVSSFMYHQIDGKRQQHDLADVAIRCRKMPRHVARMSFNWLAPNEKRPNGDGLSLSRSLYKKINAR